MARPNKRNSNPTNPNKILVIFLVFFMLATIGEGVWAYTLLKEKDGWGNEAKKKEIAETAAKREQEWSQFKCDEVLAAVGDENFYSKPDVVKQWLQTRSYFFEEPPKIFVYKDDREPFVKTVKKFEELLGWEPTGYKNKFNKYLKPTDELNRELANLKNYHKEIADKNELVEKVNSLVKKEEANRKALSDMIKLVQKSNLQDLIDKIGIVTKTNKLLETQAEEFEKEKGALQKALVGKNIEIGDLKSKIQKGEDPKSPNRALSDPHALILDVSSGKTLWDTPRGKVIRVDESARKVYIDKGSKHGVKVGLTFVVFAAGWKGRGEGPLKATLEVVRVDDEHMASCKVNSYYDVDGREIAGADATPTKLFREGAIGLKEGDLLFNLTWGMHAAVVGIVDFTGNNANSPAAQKENLDEFLAHLGRLGVIVDAYMDPRDGKFVGAISPRTNILIRGAAPADKKSPIYEAMKMTREQAVDGGMFIISADNFAVVTGYRRPGSADNPQTLTFMPRPPAGGRDLQDGPGEAQKKGP